MPILRGSAGSGRLRAGSNSPSACSFFFSCSNASCSAPRPCGSQVLADELILALRLVDAEPAAGDDAQAVLGLELEVAHGGAEHHRLDLRAAVLQREVQVPGVPDPAVRDLAFDPDSPKPDSSAAANRRGQLRDGDARGARGAGRRDLVAGLRSSSNGSSNRPGMSASDGRRAVRRRRAAPAPRPRAADRLSRSIAVRPAGRRIGGDDDRVEPPGSRSPPRTSPACR